MPQVLAHGVGELVERAEDPHALPLLGDGRPAWLDEAHAREHRTYRLARAPRPGPQGRCSTTTSTAGLRPQTIIDLARRAPATTLPAQDADGARRVVHRRPPTPARWSATWRRSTTRSRSCRPATTCAGSPASASLDLAADGVVYAEVRYAPEQHLPGGLTLDEVVEAVRDGFVEGQAAGRGATVARSSYASCSPRCGTRPAAGRSPSSPWRYRDAGRRRLRHRRAPRRATRPPGTSTRSSTSSARTRTSPSTPARPSGCRRSGRRSSGAAPTGSATACGSSTTSHVDADGGPQLGRLAAYVRDKRIPLEMCPSSNIQTGAAASIAEHPIGTADAGCGSGSRSTPTTG